MTDPRDIDGLQHLSDLEHVRLRPEMYFDLTSPLVANCMAREAYCLTIDQIVAKTSTLVTSELSPAGRLSVFHNGAALRISEGTGFGDEGTEMQMVAETIGFCAYRASSDYVNTHICKNGLTAINACSKRFELHNFTEGSHFLMIYERGMRMLGQTRVATTGQRGVMVRFTLDPEIVGEKQVDFAELQTWFESLPLDRNGLEVQWIDRRA